MQIPLWQKGKSIPSVRNYGNDVEASKRNSHKSNVNIFRRSGAMSVGPIDTMCTDNAFSWAKTSLYRIKTNIS